MHVQSVRKSPKDTPQSLNLHCDVEVIGREEKAESRQQLGQLAQFVAASLTNYFKLRQRYFGKSTSQTTLCICCTPVD